MWVLLEPNNQINQNQTKVLSLFTLVECSFRVSFSSLSIGSTSVLRKTTNGRGCLCMKNFDSCEAIVTLLFLEICLFFFSPGLLFHLKNLCSPVDLKNQTAHYFFFHLLECFNLHQVIEHAIRILNCAQTIWRIYGYHKSDSKYENIIAVQHGSPVPEKAGRDILVFWFFN